MTRLNLFVLLLISSCSKHNPPRNAYIIQGVKHISVLYPVAAIDSSRNTIVYTSSVEFKGDSAYVYNTTANGYIVAKVFLSDSLINFFNRIILFVDFNSFRENEIPDECENTDKLYCGPDYGFIDSTNEVILFNGKGLGRNKNAALYDMLGRLDDFYSESTNDTSEIVTSVKRINKIYYQKKRFLPPPKIESVRFNPN
ncbi:MAG: hypothetical protein AB1458_09310 [Bacteroidota bacterium]